MYIIGHRGAAGLAPENTLSAIDIGKKFNADALEIDIRITSDKKLVLCHDETLLRIAQDPRKVSELKLEEIRKIKTISGKKIPTITEALERAGSTPLIIEGKGDGWAAPLARALKNHKGAAPKVISYNHRELLNLHLKLPNIEIYATEDQRAFEVMANAKGMGFSGVNLAFWLINPFTYRHANRLGLGIISSPINNRLNVWIFSRLYPNIMITTDYPNRFKKSKSKKK